jgi:hypothetical protein
LLNCLSRSMMLVLGVCHDLWWEVKGVGRSDSLSRPVMEGKGEKGWGQTVCHVCDGWVSNCLLRSVISLYQFCHGLWWFMVTITAMFTMVFCSSLLDFLSRSVMPINVCNGLWFFVKICVTVCGGEGGGSNFCPYTSTLLLVGFSQK